MIVNSIQIRSGDVKADTTAQPPKPVYGAHSVRLDLVTYVYAKKGGK